MSERPKGYIPAFGYDWLLPLYDPVLRWVMREETFKRRLIELAGIRSGDRVLDLGCGTGTLTLLVKRAQPAAEVRGLDGDPKALAIARRKADTAGLQVHFDEGFSYDLPYGDASLDRVLSSLMFHHLTRADKMRTLAEVRRVLKPGGGLHVVDFGAAATPLGARVARWVHHTEHMRDNVEGHLPEFLREAGFAEAVEAGRHRTIVGSLSFYRGLKPAVASDVSAA